MTAALHVTLAEHIGPDVERQVRLLTNEQLLVAAAAFGEAFVKSVRLLSESARAAFEAFTKAFAGIDGQDDYMLVPPSSDSRQGASAQ